VSLLNQHLDVKVIKRLNAKRRKSLRVFSRHHPEGGQCQILPIVARLHGSGLIRNSYTQPRGLSKGRH